MLLQRQVTFSFIGLISFTASAVESDFARDVQPILEKHCYECHDSVRQEAGLRLDYRGGLLQGGDHGAAITLANASESLLIKRLRGKHDQGPRMPFEKPPLSEQEIATLAAWIDSGAAWPNSPATAPRRRSDHWAFQPITRAPLPTVTQRGWSINMIDRFVLAKLESKQIAPSPQADRYTLIRRVYLDLLGVPPSVEAADTFVADDSPDAYGRMVDRILNSPQYGERWGRHWLDQARYADSNGYTIDAPRSIWPYRDWVIHAINADMGFDQFTVEQLAGDLLPEPSNDQLVATGFHRNTLVNQEGGTDAEQFRVESMVDRVNTTSSVWLGLTIACAQCHTHKFDPITQREYYQLFAFFNSDQDVNTISPTLSLPSAAQQAALAELDDQIKNAVTALEDDPDRETRRQVFEQDLPARAGASGDAELKNLAEIATLAADKRTKEQQNLLDEAFEKQDPHLAKHGPALAELRKKRKNLAATVPTTMVMRQASKPRDTHIQIRGDFLRKGQAVIADTPQVIDPPLANDGQANRLTFAKWIVDARHPLTARVTVNRIWMHLFGRGLVETENDFGTQGTPPTHPLLLDTLASDLMSHGWSVKHLHRMIVTSATYQQASHARPELREIDPLNKLLSKQSRNRIEAEIVRDTALVAAGTLTGVIGGPSVYPPQPAGVYAFTQVDRNWPTETGANRFRRTMYTFFFRSAPHPLLTTFDTPDMQMTCTRRIRSNTPLQALTVANDEAMVELARLLADRTLSESHSADDRARMSHMFRLAITRPPNAYEIDRLIAFKNQQVERFTNDPSAAEKIAGQPGDTTIDFAAWCAVARVVLNLDEFVMRP